MQNIVRIHPPKGFKVPENVGSINGGVKVISDSERREIEEQNKRNQEEKDKIITVGATIAFSEPESGFITRKEGAGGDDNLEAILKIIGK